MVSRADSRQRVENGLIPAAVGLWAAAIAVVPGPPVKLAIAAPPAAAALLWWITSAPERWVAIFLLSAILLPPLPAPVGNAGVHIAPFFALAGILTGILRMNEWRTWRGSLPTVFGAFLAAVIGSVAFAALYSGWTIAAGSAARVMLFGIGLYVFFYTWAGPRDEVLGSVGRRSIATGAMALSLRAPRRLFLACLDFYFQWPAPAGYVRAQFIWVGEDVLRRAQGLFYEARARSATSVPSSL